MTANAGVMNYDSAIEHKLGCIALRPSINNCLPATTVMNGMGVGGQMSELGALKAAVFAMTAADDIAWFVDVAADLWDCDFVEDMALQILYTNDAAAADTGIVWKGFIKGFAEGAAVSAIETSSDGSITFASETASGVALGVNLTDRVGFGAPNTFGSDAIVGVSVELDADGAASPDEIGLVCARLWYTREICSADGVRQRT